jgi:hypothetical protein
VHDTGRVGLGKLDLPVIGVLADGRHDFSAISPRPSAIIAFSFQPSAISRQPKVVTYIERRRVPA